MALKLNLYSSLIRPLLFRIDAESAHRLAIQALRLTPFGASMVVDAKLTISVAGITFPNPIGMAAGFDKNAEVADRLLQLGFGFVEVGTITPKPQPGNPKPRLFRLPEDAAVINRLGFNGEGLATAKARLAMRRRSSGIVGANMGRNKDSADEVADYVTGVRGLAPLVDYCVVNISSPNTPGLRDLQGRARLAELLAAVKVARDASGARPPLFVKVAPDLDEIAIRDIAEVTLESGIDGIIATNTTVTRDARLRSSRKSETGGLSGKPVFALSTKVLSELYQATGGKVPLIGVGGIFSGEDAYAKIRAGASLVQLYTGMVYRGPGIVGEIKRDLAARLKADGFTSVSAAVGTASR